MDIYWNILTMHGPLNVKLQILFVVYRRRPICYIKSRGIYPYHPIFYPKCSVWEYYCMKTFFICISEYFQSITFKTILNRYTHLCFHLKATCFGLDVDGHQAKKFTIIKRQVKNATYKKPSCILYDPTVSKYFCFTIKL